MKKFLSKKKVLAATVAALTASPASAQLSGHIDVSNQLNKLDRMTLSHSSGRISQALILEPRTNSSNSQLNLHAQHASHASHESHASHGSHRSHYSSS